MESEGFAYHDPWTNSSQLFQQGVSNGGLSNAQKVVQFGSIGESGPYVTLEFPEICSKLL